MTWLDGQDRPVARPRAAPAPAPDAAARIFQEEIDDAISYEKGLAVKGLIALALVALVIVIRVLFLG
jgi:hypothetical protein